MNSRGFTLIEVMVAMAIAATVATIAYQSLAVSTDSAERSAVVAKRIDSIDRAWQIVETDLRHALERERKNALGIDLPPFEGGESSEYLLYFIRGGWANPLEQQRSSLQRIAYLLKEEVLWRYHWFTLDGADGEEPQELDLLSKVTDIKMRFLAKSASGVESSQWQLLWPIRGGAQDQLPIAVEVTLELEDFGEIKRLFALAPG